MSIIRCELKCNANLWHLEHVFAGFSRLHRQGKIKLSQTLSKAPSTDNWTGLHVVLNDATRIYYDLFDGGQLNSKAADEVDYYFKRSFDRSSIGAAENVHPLGLSYPVSDCQLDLFKLKRELWFGPYRERSKKLFLSLVNRNWPTIEHLQSPPDLFQSPKVLFMTKVYDPAKSSRWAEQSGIDLINTTRVSCVRALRKEFGKRFIGGIEPDDFSLRFCPDAVDHDHLAFSRRPYLSILKQIPICIATKGLWKSIGFKFAEYFAFGKAIVTEPLDYQVPGNLRVGDNYLEFTTVDECVTSVERLISDEDLRRNQMVRNYQYYQSFVRPDSLVLNSLSVSLGKSAEPRDS